MPRTSLLDRPAVGTPENEPTFAEIVAAAAYNFVGPQDNRLTENAQQVLRTWTGAAGGATGGFIIKPTWQDDIIDRARSVDGPLARCTIAYMEGRERLVPAYQESSRADGSRFGGAYARWGVTENASMDAIESEPSMGLVRFVAQRLMILSQPISRDLFADSAIIPTVLQYAFNSEIRYQLEAAITAGDGTRQAAKSDQLRGHDHGPERRIPDVDDNLVNEHRRDVASNLRALQTQRRVFRE